jgi:uncharacterized protein (TIGR03085 family)
MRVTYARDERLAICALLDKLGPDQPTLCEGWRTADLVGHLVLREHRPDAGLGVLGGPLAGRTRRLQHKLQARTTFSQLIQEFRDGPPRLSLFALPGADEQGNSIEFFVHLEDIRRAQPDWTPRSLEPGFSELLWRRLRLARLMLRKAPVGVELVRDDDGQPAAGTSGPVRITAKARAPMVTVTGTPAELTMWVFGRTEAARVQLAGSDPDVAALRAAHWGM